MARPARSRGMRARGRTVAPQRSRLPRLALALVPVALLLAGLITWQRRGDAAATNNARPIATLPSEDIHAVSWSPTEPETLYAGHHGGLLRSADGGRTWTPTALPAVDAMSLAVTSNAPQRIYVAGHGVFRRSDDAGVTWTSPSAAMDGADIHGFAQDPLAPDRLYALVVGQGVLMSADGGATWRMRAPAPAAHAALTISADGQTLLMGSENRIQHSADGGETWSTNGAALPAGTEILALALDRDVLFAATANGLYRRTEATGPWEPMLTNRAVAAIAVSPTQPTRIVAVDVHRQVFRSDDGGKTWSGRPQ